jgi:hypothetical protein
VTNAAAAAAAHHRDARAVSRVEFNTASLPTHSSVKPLFVAMAGAVNRGLNLISDVLDSSSSSSSSRRMSGSSHSSSESSRLLPHLPAVGCIRVCSMACIRLLTEHIERTRDYRRAAVDIAVLARTSGWCTSSVSASNEALL